MERAKVVGFPDGEVVDLRPKTKWVARWWPNAGDAWMSTTFDSIDRAVTTATAKLQEGARKIQIERIVE